jgi:hypothetical protein
MACQLKCPEKDQLQNKQLLENQYEFKKFNSLAKASVPATAEYQHCHADF